MRIQRIRLEYEVLDMVYPGRITVSVVVDFPTKTERFASQVLLPLPDDDQSRFDQLWSNLKQDLLFHIGQHRAQLEGPR